MNHVFDDRDDFDIDLNKYLSHGSSEADLNLDFLLRGERISEYDKTTFILDNQKIRKYATGKNNYLIQFKISFSNDSDFDRWYINSFDILVNHKNCISFKNTEQTRTSAEFRCDFTPLQKLLTKKSIFDSKLFDYSTLKREFKFHSMIENFTVGNFNGDNLLNDIFSLIENLKRDIPYFSISQASRQIPKESDLIFEIEDGFEMRANRDKEFIKPAPDRSLFDEDMFEVLARSVAANKYLQLGKEFNKKQTYIACESCGAGDYSEDTYWTLNSLLQADKFRQGTEARSVDISDQIQYCPLCGSDEIYFKKEEQWAFHDNEDLEYQCELAQNINEILLNEFLIDKGYQIDGKVDYVVAGEDLYKYEFNETKPAKPRVKLFLKDSQGNELRFEDVGSGISYMLPVLVNVTQNHYLNFIQQPELHIHPALQSQFANLFVNRLEKNNNFFIVETHSEHIILRVLNLIKKREKLKLDISADDVMINYIYPSDPVSNKSSIKKIRITEDGDFHDNWPDGFFPERYNELKDYFDE